MLSLVLLREVMDEEPSIWMLWAVSAILGIGGFYLGRRWDVGPAILAEAGRGYQIQAYLLAAASVAAPIIGALGSPSTGRTAV